MRRCNSGCMHACVWIKTYIYCHWQIQQNNNLFSNLLIRPSSWFWSLLKFQCETKQVLDNFWSILLFLLVKHCLSVLFWTGSVQHDPDLWPFGRVNQEKDRFPCDNSSEELGAQCLWDWTEHLCASMGSDMSDFTNWSNLTSN